ncbi:DUF6090 family protein [Yeosuana sp. AK3]
MIKFFRKIRKKLLEQGKTSNYLKYAIGEIVLVVVGILIALQINNWNEDRKGKLQMLVNISSIKEDIQTEISDFQRIKSVLQNQIESGGHIIPIMESETRFIKDSLQFILAFQSLTTTTNIIERTNTWNFLNATGIVSEFPDSKLQKMLQEYYSHYNRVSHGLTNSATPSRLELRELKYELFTDTEHRKFFPTNTPKSPNKDTYQSIFNDKRVLPICRYINSNATYFERSISNLQNEGEKILDYLNKNYKKNYDKIL